MPEDKRVSRLRVVGSVNSAEDAELNRLGAEFQEKHRRHVELTESQQGSAGELPREEQEEILCLMQAKQELAEAVAELRATAVSGLQAKAAILLAYSQYDLDGKLHWTDHDELMGWSIARDLCCIGDLF